MGYQDFWQPYRREVEERFPLMVERLEQIGIEETVAVPFRSYFRHTASFLLNLCRLEEKIYAGEWENKDLQDMSTENQVLYKEILPQHYAESYGNPAYATAQMGDVFGKLFGMLYADIRSLIPYAFEGRNFELTIFGELLVEIYNCFEQEALPQEEEIQQIIYWFYHDYGEIFTEISVMAQSSPELDFYIK